MAKKRRRATIQYGFLNEAEIYEDVLAPGTTEIWYTRPESFRDLNMGLDFLADKGAGLNPLCLSDTHIQLGRVKGRDLNKLFQALQEDSWSPNWEAFSLINGLGLEHTSMSVGDIIVKEGHVYFVDLGGFVDIGRVDKRM